MTCHHIARCVGTCSYRMLASLFSNYWTRMMSIEYASIRAAQSLSPTILVDRRNATMQDNFGQARGPLQLEP